MNTTNELKNFWNGAITQSFGDKKTSPYITDILQKIDKTSSVLDIGCGAGRYLRFLHNLGVKDIIGVDSSQAMLAYIDSNSIKTVLADMQDIPLSRNFDVILSVGVLHNVNSLQEFCKSLEEIKRLLKPSGMVICSIFTNDLISQDLTLVDDNLYYIDGKIPMLLLSKSQILSILKDYGFVIVQEVDEHITEVSKLGKRNVYTFIFKNINEVK